MPTVNKKQVEALIDSLNSKMAKVGFNVSGPTLVTLISTEKRFDTKREPMIGGETLTLNSFRAVDAEIYVEFLVSESWKAFMTVNQARKDLELFAQYLDDVLLNDDDFLGSIGKKIKEIETKEKAAEQQSLRESERAKSYKNWGTF